MLLKTNLSIFYLSIIITPYIVRCNVTGLMTPHGIIPTIYKCVYTALDFH